MIEDAEISIVLSQSHLAERIPQRQSEAGQFETLQIISLDRGWEPIAAADARHPDIDVAPEHPAYVIYTSGSTGRPKGVAIPHRAVVNFLLAMRERPGLSEQDTLLAVTTTAFDIAVLELFLPLTVGARLHLVSRATASDAMLLAEALAASAATVMQATPATWRMLLDSGWGGDPRLRVLCGGEVLPRELANRLRQRCGELWNMYGPTETTVWSAALPVEPGEGAVPVGRPIANTRLYVLNRHLRPTPIGVLGELYIGGVGLAQGYLNRPDLTAERFVPNPFLKDEGLRMKDEDSDFILHPSSFRLYRTGDLARYLPDGALEFLGRLDYQVKIRGFRIELGEIESALNQHPGLRESCVVVREGMPGDKRLVAYIVQGSGARAQVPGEQAPGIPIPDPRSLAPELRAFLKDKLPEYMVPATFIALECLPLLPNGKVDRRSLPAPEGARPALKEAFIPPRTRIERLIAATWQAALHIDEVGIHDNFFDIGGHSLLLIEVFNKLRDALERPDLRLFDLFKHPTIDTLAEHLASTRDQAGPAFQESYARAEVRRGAMKQLKQRRK